MFDIVFTGKVALAFAGRDVIKFFCSGLSHGEREGAEV